MQDTSNAYKTAIRLHDRPYDEVYGTITFADSSTLNITPAIIPTNGIELSRQCVSGEELEFGGVFLDTLEMTIINDNYSRYAFYEANVELNYRIWLDSRWEVIKLGNFNIAEADRPDKNTIKFTAYDDMRKLDIPLQADVMYGTPWEVLNLISQLTGYPLGFSAMYMVNFVNYTKDVYIDKDSGMRTYRDVLKSICQQLGCFAHDDRYGNLMLTNFHTASDLTLNTGSWYSNTIADYESTYIGISITSRRGTYTASSEIVDEVGNVMTIPDAPSWDYGLDETLQSMTDALYNHLRAISYTPCEIYMPSDASFDCGDMLTLETADGDMVETIITSYVWKWHGGMEISSKGVNPYLTGVSTNEIASTRLLNKTTDSTLFSYYTFINARTLSLSTIPKQLVKIVYRALEDTTVEMWHEIKVFNELSGNTQKLRLIYYRDGVEVDYHPEQTYGESGYHILGTQFWLQNIEVGNSHTWEVWAEIDNGSAVISTGDLHVLLKGQKLEIQEKADNNITVIDTVTPYEFTVYVANIIDTVQNLQEVQVTTIPCADALTPFVFGINVAGISDTIQPIRMDRVIATRITENGRIRGTERTFGVTEGKTRLTESGEL